jgi:hypothetical protein
MEVIVVTGGGGKVIGTARRARDADPAVGSGGPVAGPGQSVDVIDLPDEFETVDEAQEFHRRLEAYLGSR